MEHKTLSIGWWFSDKKRKNFGWDEISEYIIKQGHKVTRIDIDSEETHGPYDIIVNKFTDHLVVKDKESIELREKLTKIFEKSNAVIIDPFEAQEKTTDRKVMHEFFNYINQLPPEYNAACPRGITVESAEEVDALPSEFNFPCFIKSLQASGSVDAHTMRIVWSKDDMKLYGFPIYVQEYINHDATIFKVYCVGDSIHIVVRKSLPNFSKTYRSPVEFDSQKWKFEFPPEFTVDYAGKLEKPNMDQIKNLAKQISQYLGLTVFGFDVIKNIETGKLSIIDVNFFPGMFKLRGNDYKGVEGLSQIILDHFIKVASQKKE